MVLISNQILFSERPLITPFLDSITSAHISGDGRQVIIKSDCSANCFGVAAIFAPRFLKSFIKSLSKSLTIKSNLFLNKLPANLLPTLPRPIKPIFISSF